MPGRGTPGNAPCCVCLPCKATWPGLASLSSLPQEPGAQSRAMQWDMPVCEQVRRTTRVHQEDRSALLEFHGSCTQSRKWDCDVGMCCSAVPMYVG